MFGKVVQESLWVEMNEGTYEEGWAFMSAKSSFNTFVGCKCCLYLLIFRGAPANQIVVHTDLIFWVLVQSPFTPHSCYYVSILFSYPKQICLGSMRPSNRFSTSTYVGNAYVFLAFYALSRWIQWHWFVVIPWFHLHPCLRSLWIYTVHGVGTMSCLFIWNNVMFIHFVFVPSPVMIFQHYKRRTAGRCMAHMLHVQTHAHSTHHQQLHV